jgi:transcriptional regulator NrdR family protein
MVCIYCGGTTSVTNSRPQKRVNHTWRRRECSQCGAIFTSVESADLAANIRFRKSDGTIVPFSRDRLCFDITRALGHRADAISEGSALCETTIGLLFKSHSEAIVSAAEVAKTAVDVLQRFDTTAAVYFSAYHPTSG